MKAWPCAVGKDPGDMLKAGVPIRLWIEAGIAEAGKYARQGEALPLPCAPETPQNPPCATLRTKDEPKATPEENGPENGDKAAVARWWRPWPMPGTGELPAVSIRRGHVRHVYEDGTTRFVGIAAAPMIPNGPLAQRMRAAPHPDPTPKDVDTMDSLHRLAAIDTNIDALWVGDWCRTFKTGHSSLTAWTRWTPKAGTGWNDGLPIRGRTTNRAGNV